MHTNRVLSILIIAMLMSIGFAGTAGAQSPVRLFLEDGTVIGGQPIDPGSPEFTVEPGVLLTGTLVLRCENDDAAVAVVEGALSWEADHEDNYAWFGSFAQGTTHSTFPMDRLRIPSVGGTYYMILCSFAAPAPGFVASMTSPTCGAPVWEDGNDIADQDATTLAGAIASGWATLPIWMCDHVQDTPVGATYITVHVLDLPVGACCIGQSPDWECILTTENGCAAAGGVYLGEGSVCEPWPCETAARETTWGRLRSLYR